MRRKGGLSLGARQIRNRMLRYLPLAGIAKRYGPHALRHTFATPLLNAGASLEVVKELMGHRSLPMTLRYTQLEDVSNLWICYPLGVRENHQRM